MECSISSRHAVFRLARLALMVSLGFVVLGAVPSESEATGGEDWRQNERGWICRCRRPVLDADGNVEKQRGRVVFESFDRRVCATSEEATELCRNRYSYGDTPEERVDCMVYRSKYCSSDHSCRTENRGCSGDWCNCGTEIKVVRAKGGKPVAPGKKIKVGEEIEVYVQRPTDQGLTFNDPERSWWWKGMGDDPPKSQEDASSGCVYLDWDDEREPAANPKEKSTCVTGVDPEKQNTFVLRGAYASAGKKTIYADLHNWFAGPDECKYRCRAEAKFEVEVVD